MTVYCLPQPLFKRFLRGTAYWEVRAVMRLFPPNSAAERLVWEASKGKHWDCVSINPTVVYAGNDNWSTRLEHLMNRAGVVEVVAHANGRPSYGVQWAEYMSSVTLQAALDLGRRGLPLGYCSYWQFLYSMQHPRFGECYTKAHTKASPVLLRQVFRWPLMAQDYNARNASIPQLSLHAGVVESARASGDDSVAILCFRVLCVRTAVDSSRRRSSMATRLSLSTAHMSTREMWQMPTSKLFAGLQVASYVAMTNC